MNALGHKAPENALAAKIQENRLGIRGKVELAAEFALHNLEYVINGRLLHASLSYFHRNYNVSGLAERGKS